MRKQIILAVAVMSIAALGAAGCTKKEKPPQTSNPPVAVSSHEAQDNGPLPGAPVGANPHAGMKSQEIVAGGVHEGKVVSTMNGAGYTYIEVAEKGKKLWVAVMETKVKIGDTVEFADSPPMENFQSKSLGRTFDKIIFSPVIRVNGKTEAVAAAPGAVQGPGGPEGPNPHAGMKSQEMVAGIVHDGKVVSTMNGKGYTYIEVDEKGKTLWVAVMETKVKTGDKVEFPDSPPMKNFYSKSLDRTFETIIFSPVIRVNGKTEAVAAVPGPMQGPGAAEGANPHAGMRSQEVQ